MATKRVGFETMPRAKLIATSKRGGKVAHQKGAARQWSRREALVQAHVGGQAIVRQRGAAYMKKIARLGGQTKYLRELLKYLDHRLSRLP